MENQRLSSGPDDIKISDRKNHSDNFLVWPFLLIIIIFLSFTVAGGWPSEVPAELLIDLMALITAASVLSSLFLMISNLRKRNWKKFACLSTIPVIFMLSAVYYEYVLVAILRGGAYIRIKSDADGYSQKIKDTGTNKYIIFEWASFPEFEENDLILLYENYDKPHEDEGVKSMLKDNCRGTPRKIMEKYYICREI